MFKELKVVRNTTIFLAEIIVGIFRVMPKTCATILDFPEKCLLHYHPGLAQLMTYF